MRERPASSAVLGTANESFTEELAVPLAGSALWQRRTKSTTSMASSPRSRGRASTARARGFVAAEPLAADLEAAATADGLPSGDHDQ